MNEDTGTATLSKVHVTKESQTRLQFSTFIIFLADDLN